MSREISRPRLNGPQMDGTKTLIITAELDAVYFARLDGLRREHFPAERNLLSAHLTMFHQVARTTLKT
jgi:hypothetical protein